MNPPCGKYSNVIDPLEVIGEQIASHTLSAIKRENLTEGNWNGNWNALGLFRTEEQN